MAKVRCQILSSTIGILFLLSLFCGRSTQAQETITIGIILPLTGARSVEGETTRKALELARKSVNDSGGLRVGGSKYKINYAYGDNHTTANGAVTAALELISKSNVLGIIGPLDSYAAIPVSKICQSFKTPMISPTSTVEETTAGKPYIFRAISLNSHQADVLADFAISELGAQKAAVLFDASSAYPRGLAASFKRSFEKRVGGGSVVAYEDFLSNEKDLSKQLDAIVSSDADFLFLPQHAHEVPEFVKQARSRGWEKDILGGDAWESAVLVDQCGELCEGLYYGSHFIAKGAKGTAKDFVDAYIKEANEPPNFYAALGYDAANLLFTAISQLQNIDRDLRKARQAIKTEITDIQGFEGVAGTINMNSTGDPIKSAVIIRIGKDGLSAYNPVSP